MKFKWRIKLLKVFNLKLEDELKEKLLYIQNISSALNYKIKEYNPKDKKITYEKEGMFVTIQLKVNKVTTTLQHPKFLKKTSLVRSDLTLNEIGSLLFNPREHTGRGEYKNSRVRKRK